MTTFKEFLSLVKCEKCGNSDAKKFTIIWRMKGKAEHMNQDDIDKLPSFLKQLWKDKDKDKKDEGKDEKVCYILCNECNTLYRYDSELRKIVVHDYLLEPDFDRGA